MGPASVMERGGCWKPPPYPTCDSATGVLPVNSLDAEGCWGNMECVDYDECYKWNTLLKFKVSLTCGWARVGVSALY